MKLDKLAIITPLLIIFFALIYLPQGAATAFASEGQDGATHSTLDAQSQNSGESHGNAADHSDDGHGHHGHANLGEELPLYSCIPFACMLLSIALLPLVAGTFWHHHFGKISAFWAACLAIPFVAVYKG
ncbi:MAG: sodium:proton antiporter, partial [Desulfobacterales bacterium]|nr:sodium:proton antiporter [Desulfobacterales bacterium]